MSNNNTKVFCHPSEARLSPLPTNEVIPFGFQVGLIGQAALHHVKAQGVAGPQSGEASTQRAVPLTHQTTHTLRICSQLKNKSGELESWNKESKAAQHPTAATFCHSFIRPLENAALHTWRVCCWVPQRPL